MLQLGFIQSPLSKASAGEVSLDLTWAPNGGGSNTVVEDRCVEFSCSSFDPSCDSPDYTAPPYYGNAKMSFMLALQQLVIPCDGGDGGACGSSSVLYNDTYLGLIDFEFGRYIMQTRRAVYYLKI